MGPFKVAYNTPPPTLLTCIPGSHQSKETDHSLWTRDQFMDLINNLKDEQHHMTHRYDLKRKDW